MVDGSTYTFYSENKPLYLSQNVPRVELRRAVSLQSLSFDPFRDLDTGSSLGLSSLRADMAGDDRRAVRKVDKFLLPIVYRGFKVEYVESRTSDMSLLQ